MPEVLAYYLMLLRAGMGLWLGARSGGLVSEVGMLDLTRNEKTLKSKVNMSKYQQNLGDSTVLVFDTMLATAGSMSRAISHIKRNAKPRRIIAVCLLAAPEGLELMKTKHPDVDMVVGVIDEKLDDDGFIYPGLGDAGDRFFGHYG